MFTVFGHGFLVLVAVAGSEASSGIISIFRCARCFYWVYDKGIPGNWLPLLVSLVDPLVEKLADRGAELGFWVRASSAWKKGSFSYMLLNPASNSTWAALLIISAWF